MASKLERDALNINVYYKTECQTLHKSGENRCRGLSETFLFFSCWETKIPVSAPAIGKWCIKYAHLNINIFTILVLCWGYCTSSHLLFLNITMELSFFLTVDPRFERRQRRHMDDFACYNSINNRVLSRTRINVGSLQRFTSLQGWDRSIPFCKLQYQTGMSRRLREVN